jgi:hypothetical protein
VKVFFAPRDIANFVSMSMLSGRVECSADSDENLADKFRF